MTTAVSSRSTVLEDRTGWAPRFAAAGAIAVALMILALHAIKPEFEPSWRFISEYAIGRHGWIMRLTFLIWAASCAALALGLRPEITGRRGSAGLAILRTTALALVAAGLFPQDPVTATPAEASTSGMIHAIASLVGIPGIPLAAMLLSSSLWRSRPSWGRHRLALMGLAHATWISLALMAAYLAWAVPRAGGFTPDVWAGWMNRLVVATYLAWQLGIASRLIARDR